MTEQDINERFHNLAKLTWDAFNREEILRLGFIEYYGYPEYYLENFDEKGYILQRAYSNPIGTNTDESYPAEPRVPEIEPPGTDLTNYLANTVHSICEMTSSCLSEIPATPYSVFRFDQVLRGLGSLSSPDLYNRRQPGGLAYDDNTHDPPWGEIIEPAVLDHVEYMVTRLREIGDRWSEGSSTDGSKVKGSRPQWMGNASELAYLLTELIEGDHILPPARGRKVGKEGNRAAVADAIYDALDIRDPATDEPVTREYFKSLLRPNSPDRGTFKDLFKITSRPL